MNNSFKFHCILFVVAVIFGLVVDFSTSVSDLSSGVIAGWNSSGEPLSSQETYSVLVSVLFVPFFIYFWVLFAKVLISASKGDVFAESMSLYTKKMGYALLGMFVIHFLSYIPYLHERFFTPLSWLIFAAGLLIISEILRIVRVMKEEQDLTI